MIDISLLSVIFKLQAAAAKKAAEEEALKRSEAERAAQEAQKKAADEVCRLCCALFETESLECLSCLLRVCFVSARGTAEVAS